MIESVVTDSTSLIGLERIGRLDILPGLFEPILVPPAVQQEFGISLPWLQIVTPDIGIATSLKIVVDDGEAEAIALAYQQGLQIILDDQQARKVARNMGISIIGTIGVLVKAKQAELISALKPLLDRLEMNGFYMTSALKAEALKVVGE
ncbi:MAG: DUF3368 domain-containing protein [Hormoscilla sp. SP5CHS1]|nr:DUF3368 domain-containing protein [Hormoscilla sp. SP12CHS1]MBC6451985.1 DUF3368 domain-containing protein [Hormoscilla sp. SP5CHS1]